MKTNLIASTLLFVLVPLFSQIPSKPYLWPVEGANTGDNIISAPQSYYIDGALNFDNLIIGAPEGTTVLSPVDGTITSVSVGFLTPSGSVSCNYGIQSFDESLKNRDKYANIPGGSKYFHGKLGIRSNDGKSIYIWGLSGSEVFKSGQSIKRGAPIGRVAYSHYKIEEPSILISIDIGGIASDPMTPFGIKSSFIPPKNVEPILSFTQKQAKEDFMIYINVLKEAYPGLYDVVTKEELDEYVHQTITLIESNRGNLKFAEFQEIIKGAIANIHDSHIYLLGTPWKTEDKSTSLKRSIEFGWINDTLVCTNAAIKYQHLINKQIKSVNGMSADSIKKKVLSNTAVYDAKIESYKNYHLAFASFYCGLDTDLDVEFAEEIRFVNLLNNKLDADIDIDIEVTDIQNINLQGVDEKTFFSYSLNRFHNINRHKDGYVTGIFDNSTAYIGLSTFSLNQVQVEEIGAFINSISKIPNLIIDVRNNGGGYDEVIEKLYSYIAKDTLIVNSYSKVNKRSGYESFKYSTNRTVDGDSFADYVAEEGKEGFYQRPENAKTIVANPDINYKGKVYVLTNEISASAATLFPAMLIRNHRGVVVGRETRTAFHFMNALKFADIRLPNSMIAIKVPLVQCVFDTVIDERTPYGRGVLPDYPVPITIDELSFKNGDAILNYALELIENGEYFKGETSDNETKPFNILSWKVLIVVLLLVIGYLFYYKSRLRRIA